MSSVLGGNSSATVQCCVHRSEACSGRLVKTVKVAHSRLPSIGFRSWSRFLAVSLQVTWVTNQALGCHYFPPGPQLPLQPLWGLLPISLLGEQRHDGCEQFAWDCYVTASRMRFEPRPFCAWVQHANHTATETPRQCNKWTHRQTSATTSTSLPSGIGFPFSRATRSRVAIARSGIPRAMSNRGLSGSHWRQHTRNMHNIQQKALHKCHYWNYQNSNNCEARQQC